MTIYPSQVLHCDAEGCRQVLVSIGEDESDLLQMARKLGWAYGTNGYVRGVDTFDFWACCPEHREPEVRVTGDLLEQLRKNAQAENSGLPCAVAPSVLLMLVDEIQRLQQFETERELQEAATPFLHVTTERYALKQASLLLQRLSWIVKEQSIEAGHLTVSSEYIEAMSRRLTESQQ